MRSRVSPRLQRLDILEVPSGKRDKQEGAPVACSVLPQSTARRSKRRRALGTRHGVQFATTPPLPVCTDPFIILLCSVALKFAIEDLLSQTVEATEIVVLDVPSRLSQFHRNLIEGVAFKKMKPDRLPLALG
jgi:hypothetical protein